MFFKKTKQCSMCYAKLKEGQEFSIVQMKVQEGLIELEVCEDCGKFLDKSADVLRSKNVKDESI
jgi:hypothetical protein